MANACPRLGQNYFDIGANVRRPSQDRPQNCRQELDRLAVRTHELYHVNAQTVPTHPVPRLKHLASWGGRKRIPSGWDGKAMESMGTSEWMPRSPVWIGFHEYHHPQNYCRERDRLAVWTHKLYHANAQPICTNPSHSRLKDLASRGGIKRIPSQLSGYRLHSHGKHSTFRTDAAEPFFELGPNNTTYRWFWIAPCTHLAAGALRGHTPGQNMANVAGIWRHARSQWEA